jgi:hypothetical protein
MMIGDVVKLSIDGSFYFLPCSNPSLPYLGKRRFGVDWVGVGSNNITWHVDLVVIIGLAVKRRDPGVEDVGRVLPKGLGRRLVGRNIDL